MRITHRQLYNIIKEEIAHPRDHLGKNVADVQFPIVVGYEDQSEIAYNQDELDNILDDIAPRGIEYSLDSLDDVEASDRPVGASIEQYGEGMKVSKRQLQAIIKEEKSKLLSERQIGRMISAQPITRMRRPAITEQSDNMYLEALESVANSSNECLESLELASRDIGPSDKVLYDKMDDAMVMLEDLINLAHQALENADMRSKGVV